MSVVPASWPPEIFDTGPFDLDDPADVERCLDALFAIFTTDFVTSQPTLTGRPVTTYHGVGCGDGRGEAFWHLTSKERVGRGSVRDRDWDRCRRIRWPRPVIEGVASRSDLRLWGTRKPQEGARLKIALDDFSYVVVLVDRPAEVILVTGFPVPYRNYRNDLRKEWGRGPIVIVGPPATAGP